MCIRDRFQTAYSEQAQRPELAFLPRWQTCELDLAAAYAQRMSEVGKKGYGMFAKHHVFTAVSYTHLDVYKRQPTDIFCTRALSTNTSASSAMVNSRYSELTT